MITNDIVRQIDGDENVVEKLSTVTTYFTIAWVIIGGLSFIYFILLTGGKEEPYLWGFLETMQLLTHIQLINVKVPGNAALFLNENNQLFRYDFFGNKWVQDLFGLDLVPSPLPVFI